MDDSDDNPLLEPELLELFQRTRNAIDAGLSIDAEEAIEQVFAAVQASMGQNPSPSWDLWAEASEYESRGDWDLLRPRIAKCSQLLTNRMRFTTRIGI